jgi:hypothetical protein
MWCIDLLRNDRETNYETAVARQQPAWQLTGKRCQWAVFYTRAVPSGYKRDKV